ncbi:MAG: hypothetical protein ACOZF0_23580 [Thermodesulfobacteriota bacterium]
MATSFQAFHNELSYRILPFLASTVTVWICCRQSGLEPKRRFLLGASLCSLPILYYYSSILYLEMPAVALMMITMAGMPGLLTADFAEIRKKPEWFSLIAVGFIKETMAVFLLAYIGSRLAIGLISRRRRGTSSEDTWRRYFPWDEIRIQAAVLLPTAVYLFYRFAYGSRRKFEPSLAHFTDPRIYSVFFQSLLEQFGLFCLFSVLGLIILIREKKKQTAGFILLTFLMTFLLIAADNPSYVGYSRFNLLLFPAIMVPAVEAIRMISRKRETIAGLILCATIAVNFAISPIHMDGTKKPLWGSGLCDTAEHYYPYREALRWLKSERAAEPLLFAGLNYSYYFRFYFDQLGWEPRHAVMFSAANEKPVETPGKVFFAANRNHYKTIVYHIPHEGVVPAGGEFGYGLKKVFRNQAHALAVYGRW